LQKEPAPEVRRDPKVVDVDPKELLDLGSWATALQRLPSFAGLRRVHGACNEAAIGSLGNSADGMTGVEPTAVIQSGGDKSPSAARGECPLLEGSNSRYRP